MATRQEAELPDLLTVEEAAALLRVGRTKAYAMAKQWRATGGRSGLPVLDFGSVLRVPRAALESRLGVELTRPPAPPACPPAEVGAAPVTTAAEKGEGVSPPARRRRGRGRTKVDPGQLSLLSAAQCSDVAEDDGARDATEPFLPVKA